MFRLKILKIKIWPFLKSKYVYVFLISFLVKILTKSLIKGTWKYLSIKCTKCHKIIFFYRNKKIKLHDFLNVKIIFLICKRNTKFLKCNWNLNYLFPVYKKRKEKYEFLKIEKRLDYCWLISRILGFVVSFMV